MDEEMEHSNAVNEPALHLRSRSGRFPYLVVLIVSATIYLGCIVSPPSLMDDVDAVQAQISRNMLSTGDWVTARLDGVAYLEKAPLVYWLMAVSYRIFGVHDWAARLPIALSVIGLCLLTSAFGIWAFGRRAGLYAGLCVATCTGLFLFTRILIPDVILTLAITLAMWSFLRVMDEEESRPGLWAVLFWTSAGVGLLLKSLIGILFPLAAVLTYLSLTRQVLSIHIWRRLHPFSGLFLVILIAAPWHILATLRNPPFIAWTLHSGPGQYHGFLWFYFVNEQVLRFLNLRYPRDYNTVPRLQFWLLHFIWLFPWSVYLPAALKLSFKPVDRAGRTRLLALCWAGFLLAFFTLSTTQEYYSMPCYPALALLIGSAMEADSCWIRRGTWVLTTLAACAALAAIAILVYVRNQPAAGDISSALTQHPSAYTLSLGHMEDLTLSSFAYLRWPLFIAACAFLVGALGTFRSTIARASLFGTLMMVMFFHAARLAMVAFDPYLSSRPLATALLESPEGELIVDHHYYTFSSIFFYTNRPALLLNGRFENLEYGSNAPDAPPVFLGDSDLQRLWSGQDRYYLVADISAKPRLEGLVGKESLHIVASSGGKILSTNHRLHGRAAN
jgi:4-amino-4-deoxy-L-arabinose transferase-like glycosyltransferase